MHRFSAEEIAWLEAHVKGRSFQELTELFNAHFKSALAFSQVRAACHNRGFTTGRDTRFVPGQRPHNAGIKGWGAGAAGKGSQATRFPKGHQPANYQPVGSERRTTPHRRYGFYQIDVKIADPDVWKAKHLLVWEAEHGPVPPGHVLVFADQNRENCSLENLLLVTRGELARANQNHLIYKDADLTKSGVAVAKVMAQMHKRRSCRKGPLLKCFDIRRHGYAIHKEAVDFALSGGQALCIHTWGLHMGPRCFQGAPVIGKLMDQDAARLEATARRLGVRRVVICRRGRPGQHVDLVGHPLLKAMQTAGAETKEEGAG